jgi:hypothetical protein
MPPVPSAENILPDDDSGRPLISALDIDYWLGHCQGLRVDSSGGGPGASRTYSAFAR